MGSPQGNLGAGGTWWKSSSRPSLKFILKTDQAGGTRIPHTAQCCSQRIPFGVLVLDSPERTAKATDGHGQWGPPILASKAGFTAPAV